jgi:serine protease
MRARVLSVALVAFASIAVTLPHLVPAQLAPAREAPFTQVIVKWRGKGVSVGARSAVALPVLDAAEQQVGASARPLRMLATGGEVLRLDQPLTKTQLAEFVQQLRDSGQVEYVEEDVLVKGVSVPDDPRYGEQWGLSDPISGMNLPAAWDRTRGSDVVVAVVDSGYLAHEDLAANTIPTGYDFISDPTLSNDGDGRDSDARDPGDADPNAPECATSSWHGSLVAGTITAVGNNFIGVTGVAYGARVLPVRVLGRCNTGFISDVADAVTWAAGGSVPDVPPNTAPARVINLSLALEMPCSQTMQAAANFAADHGALVIAAAGNGSAADSRNYTPASCDGVMPVVALNRDGTRRSDSNVGGDVAAPGESLSTGNSGITNPASDSYVQYAGTSAAAAHVSGVAALIISHRPQLEPEQVRAILGASARPFAVACDGCGSGIVDAAAALAALALPPRAPSTISGSPSPRTDGAYSVQWTPVLLATRYVIQRQVFTIWAPEETLAETTRPWTGQAPADYMHRVKACNENGCGAWTAGAPVKVIDPALVPDAPSSISTDSTFSIDGTYIVSWPSVSLPAQRRATYYILERGLGSTWSGSVTTGATVYQRRNLSTGTYTNRVRACNFNGCNSGWRTGAVVEVDRTVPPRPGFINVTPVTYNGITKVVWPASARATRYELQRFANSAWRPTIEVTSPYTLSEQELGRYKYRVRGCNVNGCSADWRTSGEARVEAPLPPADITFEPGWFTYTISWRENPFAHHYILQRSYYGLEWDDNVHVSETSWIFSREHAGLHRVRSCNAIHQCGDWTHPVAGP